MRHAAVLARCVDCKVEREIAAGEVGPGDMPQCRACGSVMVAVSAVVGERRGRALVACGICGEPTAMAATKRCDRCYELESRIRAAPALARKILRGLGRGSR